MISITQKTAHFISGAEESLYIKFPFSADILSKVKSLPIRKYHTDTKEWEVPLSSIQDVIKLFPLSEINIDEKINLDYEEPQKFQSSGNPADVFEKEINAVQDKEMRGFLLKALNLLPEYFYHVAASSTGKYHPDYALGEGGLVRHTKAAVGIAEELFRNDTIQHFTPREKDMVRVALCLHDGVKHGIHGSSYTVTEHPLEVVKYLEERIPETETLAEWEIIKSCIESHMGQWNKDYKTNKEVLPLPQSTMQRFVHMCDYLASRKCLEFNFNVEER